MAFATKYSVTFKDLDNLTWEVLFKEDGYSGAVTTFTAGPDPLTTTYEQEEKYQPIVGSAADIRVVWQSEVDGLYTEESQDIKVEITRNSADFWQGFLMPGMFFRSFNEPKHYVTLTASDGLGELKNIKFHDANGYPYYNQQTEITAIANILQKTGFQRQILEAINIYEDDFDKTDADSPLEQTYFYAEGYWDEVTDESQSCYDVLYDILKKYGATIRQDLSMWYILRPNNFSVNIVRCRIYSYAGVYQSNSTYTSYNNIGSTLYYIHGDAQMRRLPSIGRCEIEAAPRIKDNVFKNGSFDIHTWDGPDITDDPYHWTNSGCTYDRDGNTIKIYSNGASGVPNTYIYCVNTIYRPESLRLVLNYKVVYTNTPAPTYVRVILWIQCDSYYLQTDGTWTTTAPTYANDNGLYIYDLLGGDNKASMTVFEDLAINIPPIYEAGGWGWDPTFTIRIHTLHNDNGGANNHWFVNSARLEVDYEDIVADHQIYSHDNSITVYNTRKDSLNLCDSWLADEFGVGSDDVFYITQDALGTGNETYDWSIYGDQTASQPIAELLARQYVEGYRRSLDIIRASLRTTTTEIAVQAFRDANFVDEYGYAKRYFPCGIELNARYAEWRGQWVECPATYTDESIEWDNHDFGEDGSIVGDTLTIDATITSASNPEDGVSDDYTAVAGENIRIVLLLEDNGPGSDLPTVYVNHSVDGQTEQTVAWGTNYLEYYSESAGTINISITGDVDDELDLDATITFYSLTGI